MYRHVVFLIRPWLNQQTEEEEEEEEEEEPKPKPKPKPKQGRTSMAVSQSRILPLYQKPERHTERKTANKRNVKL